MPSARHVIEAATKAKPKPVVKVRFDPNVLRDQMPIEDDASGEAMWVEPFWHDGDVHLGYLRNDAYEFPLTYGDIIAYVKFPAHAGVAVDAYHPDDFTRQQAIADATERLAEFRAAGAKEHQRVVKQLSCVRCGDPGAYGGPEDARGVWMVTDQAWSKVPTKYRDKILCKRCFKELTGLDPKTHSRFDDEGNVIAGR